MTSPPFGTLSPLPSALSTRPSLSKVNRRRRVGADDDNFERRNEAGRRGPSGQPRRLVGLAIALALPGFGVGLPASAAAQQTATPQPPTAQPPTAQPPTAQPPTAQPASPQPAAQPAPGPKAAASQPASATPVNGKAVAAAMPDVQKRLDAMYPQIDALYRDLHAHPELAFEEMRTAARLAAEMKALGFQVTEGVGKTGVVAILENGPGPTVLVRTELDGLPMEEKTDLPYASKARATYQGKETATAHSCAHDLHMASWVATARALSETKPTWKGRLMFVAQPAEEVVTGARAMLDDGLYTRFGKPDYALALHSSPAPAGTIGYNVGAMTSNSDSLDITFKGRGGHGSAPHMAVDPVLIASRFVVDVQSAISREKDPMAFGVITIGAFNAGSAGNIIPDNAVLRGTVRSYDDGVRDKLHASIRRTAEASALVAGAPAPDVSLTTGGRAILNDGALVGRIEPAFRAAVGANRVGRVPPITASEDFSAFLGDGVPGVFFFVGVSDPARIEEAARPGGRPLPFNHSPYFQPVPEPAIKAGSAAMTGAVLELLAPN